MKNLRDNILQVTESKYYTQNSKYLLFCDKVYIVPTWSFLLAQSFFLIYEDTSIEVSYVVLSLQWCSSKIENGKTNFL